MTDIVVTKWAELCELVFHYRKQGRWVFRGEGHTKLERKDGNWVPEKGQRRYELKPKIGRRGVFPPAIRTVFHHFPFAPELPHSVLPDASVIDEKIHRR